MPVRIIDGVAVGYPDDWSPQQIDEHARSLKTDQLRQFVPAARPGSAEHAPAHAPAPTVGEVPRGGVERSVATIPVQMPPGIPRYAGIAGGQFVKGAMETTAIPGDISNIASRMTGGIIPDIGYNTGTIDRFLTETGITPPTLTPQGFGERALAGAARGVGQATTGGMYGSVPKNVAAGLASGVASEFAQYNPNQEYPAFGPLVPAAAGLLAGMGAARSVDALGRAVAGNPYNNVIARLGVDIENQRPLAKEAMVSVRNDLAKFKPGGPLAGHPSANDFQVLTQATKQPASFIKKLTDDPDIAYKFRTVFPDSMDDVTASIIAKAQTNPNTWNKLHPQTKEALVPNETEREAINARFSPRPTATQTTETQIKRGVMGDFWSNLLGNVGAAVSHGDSNLGSALRLLGASIPYIRPAWQGARDALGLRGSMLGGALGAEVGLEPGYNMLNPQAPPR
jgi:hypothetical protein